MSIDTDQKDSQVEIIENHKKLIDEIWPQLTQEGDKQKKNFLSEVFFKEDIFYPEGLYITLWELEPASKLCIAATSGEAFLVGGIWRNSPTKDSLFYRLGYEGQCRRGNSYVEFYHNRNQEYLDQLLFNWYLSYERNKKRKNPTMVSLNSGVAKDEFLRLKSYRSYVEASYIWEKRQDLMNPLLYIVFRGMHNYYGKYWQLDDVDPLIMWLSNSINLPENY